MNNPPRRNIRATLIGTTAVLMWGTLALFTKLSGPIPPFQLTAMAFTLAFLIGVGLWVRSGDPIISHLRLPPAAWAVGIFGLFGYHFFYFIALQNAPPVAASLIAYLWPLFIVLFSAFLPGETLRWFHVAGAVMGFAGAGLLVTNGASLQLEPQYTLGYLCAVACAFIWSGYSFLSRRLGEVPTSSVGGFCGVTAVLALLCHLLFEQTVWPQGGQWFAILYLGIGPIGAAFFTWDYGVKHGSLNTLGTLSYAAPLISTVLLVLFGYAQPSWIIGLACLLIVGGAGLAAGEFLK